MRSYGGLRWPTVAYGGLRRIRNVLQSGAAADGASVYCTRGLPFIAITATWRTFSDTVLVAGVKTYFAGLFRVSRTGKLVLWVPDVPEQLQVRLVVCAHMGARGHRGQTPTLVHVLRLYCV